MNRANWINVRMRKLLADDFCPECTKHRMLHDDKSCGMRFILEEEPCVSFAPSSPLEQWLP